jgi:hypothetical protein
MADLNVMLDLLAGGVSAIDVGINPEQTLDVQRFPIRKCNRSALRPPTPLARA